MNTLFMDNATIFEAAIRVAAIFTVAKIALHVFFPTFAGLVWQTILAPFIVPRWPTYAQCDDMRRHSYLSADHALVYRFGVSPAPIRELSTGMRDGFLIGVLFVLIPTFIPLMRIFMVFWIMLRIWQISRCPNNAVQVDEAFSTVHWLLLFIVAQEAVAVVGAQYGLPHPIGHWPT